MSTWVQAILKKQVETIICERCQITLAVILTITVDNRMLCPVCHKYDRIMVGFWDH